MGDLRTLADCALLACRTSTKEPSAPIERHSLDLPDRSAVARLTRGVRQMELRVEAIPSLVRDWRLGPLAQALADGGGALDMLQMIDSTYVKAQRAAFGAKGGVRRKRSAVRAVGSAPRSICVATPQVSPSGSYSARARPMT